MDHPRPALTVDVVLLAGSPARSVLLVRRANDPFKGEWVLPGGFVDAGETVLQAAPRELREETGVELDASELELLGVWDTPGRDPRGWTVSVVHVACVDDELPAEGQDDAQEARWFAVESLPELAFDHPQIVAAALALDDVASGPV